MQRWTRPAFTLVELLVVIAIIGVLVALLLPAVQAAREAARRTQCSNQVRQIGLAILNLENGLKTFPSGGVEPYPLIEHYSAGGRPFGPAKQGLSWAFQILPYLEENAVHNIATTTQLTNTPISMYYCPSRRSVAPKVQPYQGVPTTFWLIDYAAMTAAPSRGQVGDSAFDALLQPVTATVAGVTYTTTTGCRNAHSFWGIKAYGNDFNPRPAAQLGSQFTGFWGVIVRSSYHVNSTSGAVNPPLGYGPLIRIGKVRDGTSKTVVIAEKRLRTNELTETQINDDDRGWSDGWDLDTVRLGLCPPKRDGLGNRQSTPLAIRRTEYMTAGSAHPGGFNVWFADGSVRLMNYDIDLENWNRMAHRADGEVVSDLP